MGDSSQQAIAQLIGTYTFKALIPEDAKVYHLLHDDNVKSTIILRLLSRDLTKAWTRVSQLERRACRPVHHAHMLIIKLAVYFGAMFKTGERISLI